MSLVDRVSLFFLAALGLVLAGMSLLFYGFVERQLTQQFDQQLHGALHTLVAAVEVEPDDVKFERSDHTIGLGAEDGVEDVRWVVCDEQGLPVDRSRNLEARVQEDEQLIKLAARLVARDDASSDLGSWRILQQKLAAPMPKPVAERDPLERSEIVVTVARSPADLNANLRQIGILAISLPVVVWIIAAVAGRWYCATALQPVTDMATQARAMAAGDDEKRLPVAETRDELADLGQAFNGLLDRVYEALEKQRQFTGNAAHQLRTPLTALIGEIEVTRRRPRSADEYARTLDVVHDQGEELQRIVESLLFLARAESDAAPPDLQLLDLAEWLPKRLDAWRHHPRYADLQTDCDADLRVKSSPALLGQLVDNLVSNALKYSPAGSRVEIEIRRDQNQIAFSVRDRGPGISLADRETIFQPFFRSASARQSGVAGTGLGLAVAARIATVLGGTLTCESDSQIGTLFRLMLPAI